MDKILADILLPATGKHYDFWIPNSMPLGDVAVLVARALQLAEPDYYQASDDACLMRISSGEIIDPLLTAAEAEIPNGERFALM